MGSLQATSPDKNGEFSERAFFLKAFQNIYLTFVLSQDSDMSESSLAVFRRVLLELTQQHKKANGYGGKCLILFRDFLGVSKLLHPLFSSLAKTLHPLDFDHYFFPGQGSVARIPHLLWQSSLQRGQPRLIVAGLKADTPQQFATKIRDIGVILRMSRLVWIDAKGGITDANGRLMAFSNNARLAERIRKEQQTGLDARWHLLEIFRSLLMAGVKAISLCRLADLDQELFTYQGCGSFFSQQPYCQVRQLGLDDFERAANLIRRGEQEGFLLPRTEQSIAEILAGSYGGFILEGHLAGLCALQTTNYQNDKAGEVVSLYTLTRFQRTGVGVQLLRALIRDAQRLGLRYLFACTRHERVAQFFLHARLNRHRFLPTTPDQIPESKWHGYDPERKKQVFCVRLNVIEPASNQK